LVGADNTISSLASVGTSGQVLTSNGAAAFPTWESNTSFTQIVIQTFTSNGTYTPTSGMKYCIVEVQGGGGGGAGSPSTSSSEVGAGGGGGGGGYGKNVFSAATIGSSQAVTVGSGGAGGVGKRRRFFR